MIRVLVRGALCVLCLFMMAALLFAPSVYTAISMGALDTVLLRLFPALYPYLFFGALLCGLCRGPASGRKTGRLIQFSAIFVSLLCGFPSGQTELQHACREGLIAPKTAKRLSLALCVPSPAFCISYVGRGIFHKAHIGLAIYLCAALSSLILIGILHIGFTNDRPTTIPVKQDPRGAIPRIISQAFTGSIASFWKIAAGYFLFDLLFRPLTPLQSPVLIILYAFFEPIGGLAALCSAFPSVSVAFSAFFVFFGGICACFSAYGTLRSLGIRMRVYLAFRQAGALIAVLFLKIAENLFHFL